MAEPGYLCPHCGSRIVASPGDERDVVDATSAVQAGSYDIDDVRAILRFLAQPGSPALKIFAIKTLLHRPGRGGKRGAS